MMLEALYSGAPPSLRSSSSSRRTRSVQMSKLVIHLGIRTRTDGGLPKLKNAIFCDLE